jgi:hypothetical protein
LLAGTPRWGAALGLGNLIAALVYRLRERPNRAQRFDALLHNYSPYDSVTLTLAGFFLLEAMAGGVIVLALHLLRGLLWT